MKHLGGLPRGVVLAVWIVFAASPGSSRAAAPFSSPRTLVVAVEVDRDGARVIGFTVKDRPYVPLRESDGPMQLEVALVGAGGVRYTQRVSVSGLCLVHGPEAPAEIEGDTIRLHRETILVEEPELAGFDKLEVTHAGTTLAAGTLDAAHYAAAGGKIRYEELAIAQPNAAQAPQAPQTPLTQGAVHFPEEYGDPDIFTLYGDAAETGKRMNIVIVPDGYTHAQKPLLQAHAQALVDAFRARTPYKEHDRFINYTLVYAYSTEDGTDQCDCAIVRDTAMSTQFPNATPACASPNNRCLYYGSGCDTDSSAHIAATELRAPARDKTIVMVNTARYGGCGGERAVYSAANISATEIVVHEMGHTFANLVDEYGGTPSCGTGAGVNVSMDPVAGSWPEWIPELGAPSEGAQFYDSCIYRPAPECQMRTLGSAFCPVCTQHLALTIFGSTRVSPTAPVESASPSSPVHTDLETPTMFSVVTRLPSGSGITNAITWQVQGPGFPSPTTVATDTASYTPAFSLPGTYTLTARVVADANIIKPPKNGANVDTASWTVSVCDPAEIAPASNNGPVCAGATLQLSAASVSGATYDWTGPAGFHATVQNPSIAGAAPAASGTYAVTITAGGCTFGSTTDAVVAGEGSTCNDGNHCTTDTCHGGLCVGTTFTCDDGSVCTSDSCNPATGCVFTDNTAACVDGNVCTSDGCNPATGCVFANNTAPCSDGNPCTSGDTCGGGTCHGGSVTNCFDANACTIDSCNSDGTCDHVAVQCTASDACHQPGTCNPATGICSNPVKDTDGDGHPDPACGGDDCNDLNGQVWLLPFPVDSLHWLATSPPTLTWADQRTTVGPGTGYDLVSGKMKRAGLIEFAGGACLAASIQDSYTDTRPMPTGGFGWWYLVRARNVCGDGTYGSPNADVQIPPCPP